MLEGSEVTFFTRRKVDAPYRIGFRLPFQQEDLESSFYNQDQAPQESQLLFDSQMSAFQSAANEDDEVMRIIRSCDSQATTNSSDSLQSRRSMTALESWASISNYGPLCTRCGRPTGDDTIIHKSLPYHHRHFTCKRCNTPLSYDNVTEINGEVFCTNCTMNDSGGSRNSASSICNACGAPRGPASIVAGGKCFCRNHFRCTTCNCELDLDKFVQRDGLFYCLKHEPQKPKIYCGKCNAEVEERSINALGKVYHPGCFSCSLCNRSLANQQYTAWKNNPICQDCFKKLPRHIRQAITKMAMKTCL